MRPTLCMIKAGWVSRSQSVLPYRPQFFAPPDRAALLLTVAPVNSLLSSLLCSSLQVCSSSVLRRPSLPL